MARCENGRVGRSISHRSMRTCALRATPVAESAGVVEVTVGGVVSGAAPVVKYHVKFAPRALPAASFAAVVILAR